MTDAAVDMDPDARDEFLGRGGTGVLAFASGDEAPHAVPVSYGYDATDRAFYFRLAVGPDSRKTGAVDRPVTFVVHGPAGEGWRSVVARGRLESTTDEAIADETIEGLERVRIPYVDIFGDPPRDVQFEFYRLAPEALTARRESPTGT